MKLIVFFLVIFNVAAFAQKKSFTHCISSDEYKLYQLIMEYRKEKGLPEIPLSVSLCYVANVHAKDVAENHPDEGDCNMHSWSNKGNWEACCYTPDHKKGKCMWKKPAELTNYTGNGYEISHGGSEGYTATPLSALNGWKGSSGHNAVIINQGIWSDKWNAIGIGMYKGYAMVWFGNETDADGAPVKCK